jgi:hypothetical protein
MLLHNYHKINPIIQTGQQIIRRNTRLNTQIQNQNSISILIVCYTNHALDQLLMHISKFLNEGVEEIVRIGGRSKEEALSGCNLTNIKSRYKHSREFPSEIHVDFKKKRDQLTDTIKNIKNSLETLNISPNLILNFSKLHDFFENRVEESLFDNEVLRFYGIRQMNDRMRNIVFSDWLGTGDLESSFDRSNIREAISEMMDERFPFEDGDYQDYEKYEEDQSEKQLSKAIKEKVKVDSNEQTIQNKSNYIAEEVELVNEQREIDEDIENKDSIRQLFDQTTNEKNNKKECETINQKNNDEEYDVDRSLKHDFSWKKMKSSQHNRQNQIKSKKYMEMTDDEVRAIADLWQLNSSDRIRFYKYLSKKYFENLSNKLEKINKL